jgi:hypothetical protein
MAKRRKSKKRRKTRRKRSGRLPVGGDLPLNLLGCATYQQLVDYLEKMALADQGQIDKTALYAVRDELERRRHPIPIRIRTATKADDGMEVYHRVRAQVRRWCEHYGYGFDYEAEHWLGFTEDGPRSADDIPVQIDTELGDFTPDPDAQVPTAPKSFFGEYSGQGQLTLHDGGDRMIEVPLRVLTRLEESKPRIDYIPTTAPREAVNEILGCESVWRGSPPDRVVLYPKGSDGHGPVVLACGRASEPFKDDGMIQGPLAITDLTEEAETAFMRSLLADHSDARRVTRSDHQQIVEYNLLIRQQLVQDNISSSFNQAKLWPQLRDAVIFEFPARAYSTLAEAFEQQFVAQLQQAVDKEHFKVKPSTEDLSQRFTEQLIANLPELPKERPFPACYFAWGAGVEVQARPSAEDTLYQEETRLLATLLMDDGDMVAFVAIYKPGQPVRPETVTGLTAVRIRANGSWVISADPHAEGGAGIHPFIVTTMINYVNDHKTLIEEGKRDFGYHRMVTRAAKKVKLHPPIPPPFYTVYLQDKVIEEHKQRTLRSSREIEWQHRWHCRGSWNIRVKRGSLPIDPEVEADLRARKYQIFAGIPQMPAELAVELHQRDIAPRGRDEWLAVLRYWRKAHVKGPEDKPLVESVRRSTKKWGDGNAE